MSRIALRPPWPRATRIFPESESMNMKPGKNLEYSAPDGKHLLTGSAALLPGATVSGIRLLTGAALETGYPLTHAAARAAGAGLSVALFSEWRARRKRDAALRAGIRRLSGSAPARTGPSADPLPVPEAPATYPKGYETTPCWQCYHFRTNAPGNLSLISSSRSR